ncbi:MAG: sodium:alanine symporter family protein [Oscillospiraceae bacterium]|nr:sodium:alanine symporter family protein [Oscillospiraceae bacterium]
MERLAQLLWGAPMMLLLLFTGMVLTKRTRFVQLRRLPAALSQMGKSLRQERSGFRAVCTALAATVGTGNIAGVAGAIALGGPGAVFWMWVAAFFGMATKYAEVSLAMRYRTEQGRGGPMYYIVGGMGKRFRPLATCFAFFAVLASFAMGNMVQINTITGAVIAALPSVDPRWTGLAVGLAAAFLVGLVTLGGVKRIGRVMELLVPVVAGVYVVSMMAVIVLHWGAVGNALSAIVTGAFCPRAVLGGGVGIGLRQAICWGVSRGVFSNEAGLGSAPIAHAGSKARPEEQGLLGIFEVFLDTIVLCTLTALAILTSGIALPYGTAVGAQPAIDALETVFASGAPWICTLILGSLALATMISWQLYGLRCAEYLWGRSGAKGYAVCYTAVTVLGATMDLSNAWALADVCNGLMCLPNLIALLVLGGKHKSD